MMRNDMFWSLSCSIIDSIILLYTAETWFRQPSLEHLGWDLIRSASIVGQGKIYLGWWSGRSWRVECRQSGNPCQLGFVGEVCANKWFHFWDLNETERRVCGIWRDQKLKIGCGIRQEHKFKIGLIRSYENLMKRKIRTMDWWWTSGWWITYTMFIMSIFSVSFLSYCMSG